MLRVQVVKVKGLPRTATLDSSAVWGQTPQADDLALTQHPSSYLRDNIPGFISIVQLGDAPNYLLAWIPEASLEGTPDFESYVLVELYADSSESPTLVTLPPPSSAHAFSIPIPSLYSLVIQPPTLSSWFGSVTFNLFGGQTLPPLYFHDEESRSSVRQVYRLKEASSSLTFRVRDRCWTATVVPKRSEPWVLRRDGLLGQGWEALAGSHRAGAVRRS